MPAFLLPLAGVIASQLAVRGLTTLQSVFNGATDQVLEEVGALIKEKTNIDISDAAEARLSEADWQRLRDFELQHEALLRDKLRLVADYNIDRIRLANADRLSARALQQRALEQVDPFVRRFVYIYAYGLTLLTFGFIFFAVLYADQVSPHGLRIIDTVLGFLLGVGLAAIIQFFYGSSQGSKDKARHINRLIGQGSAPSWARS